MKKFKKIFASFIIAFIIGFPVLFLSPKNADAAVRVRGYYRTNGTYVNSYYRSNPNSTKYDNWSTKGNYNIFTGKKGYRIVR